MDKTFSYPYSFLLVVCLLFSQEGKKELKYSLVTDLPWCKTKWLLTAKINKISPVLDLLINYIKILPY